MPDSVQLIVNGVTVFQTGAAPPNGPANPPPILPPAPIGNSTTRQTIGPFSAANGVNRQLQSTMLNDRTPGVRTVAFAIDVPADATGTRIIEFTNATYATGVAVYAALSRNPDDANGAEGVAFPSRIGTLISGNMEFSVNGGYGDAVLTSGRWYLVLSVADMNALHALSGYQADRLAWLRDSTVR